MRRLQHIVLSLAACLITIGMASCSGDDCPINNTVMGKMAFYNALGDAVAINGALSISVVRPQGDSVILNRMSAASEATFPLSYTHKVDTLVFHYDFSGTSLYDTLYIGHTNTPTLVSIDCGTAMFHTITMVNSTHTLIDTLIIKSSEIDYNERENIQVIYRTDD